ncbi:MULTISPECIES: TraR/DksA C4-type zinc finger protein [unclassified Oceanobacter]|uniref:TraR/DksA C4-type zinc finger protein n=1 Tax=Oceanobacter antarcticus TaxID=3133425 RepID=A0ABW8NEW3_9GAMM|nr:MULTISPECIES: TraR/DksA C4-type zinc finger protein [unclassified Oceanobacter]MDP2548500.1 TraR/DksA C4-type zinc finger protein [Oceanobacter sp. 4_MG-2023]MDP2607962.1 TraR/DksA C4-type zinc finger protein [Oceanobacter sp. 1_MG-2023]MDP2611376.1 TraR/DksA C4-type zinc finger protein [Oceanobacter sp. 2_MG-2023]
MPDFLDAAKELEQQDRERALANHSARLKPEPAQWVQDGVVMCIDCACDIEPERLAAKPNAARCIDCQQLHELKDHC